MYTIREAAHRAGVTPDVLRAWERRYGVVTPRRTAAGYRLYDDTAIARLRAMHGLIDEGWTASSAAEHVLTLPESRLPTTVGRSAPAEGADDLSARFVGAAAAMDAAAVEAALDEMRSRASFENAVDRYLFPALRALGQAWAEGRVSVAGEHLASGAAQRRLAAALEAAGSFRLEGPPVLVGLPPGARHELGALAFAAAARRAGLAVRYLGADLPAEDWARAARATEPDAVVIGVPTRDDLGAAQAVARRIAPETRAGMPIAFGGEGAAALPGDARLPDGLTAAVDDLKARIHAG